MKTVTMFAAAFVLALSAVALALASDFEGQTNAERKTYLYTADARLKQTSHVQADVTRGIDALAQAPARRGQVFDPAADITDAN
jgi:hypothetical protein